MIYFRILQIIFLLSIAAFTSSVATLIILFLCFRDYNSSTSGEVEQQDFASQIYRSGL